MHRNRSAIASSVAAALLLSVRAICQQPPAEPQPASDSKPATIPGLSPETFTVPPGRYYPEGTFLVRRTGTVRMLKTGDIAFIPDAPAKRDPRRRGERPMLLLPCQTLAALQSSVLASPDGEKTRIEVSGQLFVYRDRQQLLPTIFSVLQPSAKPETPEAHAPASTEKSAAPAPSPEADDPEISRMISELESQRTESRPTATPGIPEAKAVESTPEKGAAGRPLVPEGTLLVDRRCRLVRAGDKYALAFDGDPDGTSEPAMILLRTRALERLEAAVAHRADSVELVVSGRVYAYRNQNYVLPVLAQIEAQGQLRPLQ
ncbi:MAG: hypothetical protein JSR52_08625 [Planctomycetes bacterium]|nr:hypothetical protein [Planctomycetota bacterium]